MEAIANADADELERLQTAYKKSNRNSKTKAVERVEELTEISRYTKPDKSNNYVNAAHAIEGAITSATGRKKGGWCYGYIQ